MMKCPQLLADHTYHCYAFPCISHFLYLSSKIFRLIKMIQRSFIFNRIHNLYLENFFSFSFETLSTEWSLPILSLSKHSAPKFENCKELSSVWPQCAQKLKGGYRISDLILFRVPRKESKESSMNTEHQSSRTFFFIYSSLSWNWEKIIESPISGNCHFKRQKIKDQPTHLYFKTAHAMANEMAYDPPRAITTVMPSRSLPVLNYYNCNNLGSNAHRYSAKQYGRSRIG